MDINTTEQCQAVFSGRARDIDFVCKYAAYLDFLNYVFAPEDKGNYFMRILPKLYNHPEFIRDCSYVTVCGDDFKGAVGAFPFEASVMSKTLKGRIIGNVAVHPDSRSKGYMKTLMSIAMDDACREDIDYVVLGGQRQRYQYFSFDNAGSELTFYVSSTNIRHRLGAEYKSELELREISSTDMAYLSDIDALHKSKPFHAVRHREILHEILTTWNCRPFAAYREGKIAGYMVFNSNLDTVWDFTAVSQSDYDDLLASAIRISNSGSLNIKISPAESSLAKYLEAVCEGVTVSDSAMFSILNFKNVITAFLNLKASYSNLGNGCYSIGIDGKRGYESLLITIADGVVTVENHQGIPELCVNQNEAVSLLFGAFSAQRNNLPPFVASWLPLPIYMCNIDNG